MDITTPEGRRDFIFANWPTYAAPAYGAYQAYGRGVLVIDCQPQTVTDTMRYWHGELADEAGLAGPVNEYNPEEEILVVFAFPTENKFARFRPHDAQFAPPLMAQQFPDAANIWTDAA
ncbi:MAG: hypothetical protein KBE23_12525 [Chloroflexi bacterium]|nr:hypothetical protein [Chloroflexota bacterium]MBP7043563.1 hypothetical protein [Chloroflexota bacterium]